ncbi:MAG: Ig-like domain-containing protein [Clostridia bacterium]|nr:Ig-like domain-containing protein [Clostridia bacterium]
MAKKLILLILALPLVLMIVLFALTRTVGSAIDAPVTGIQVVGEHTAYISLDAEETYTIEYAILPTTAKNRDIVVQTAAVGTLPEATFVIDHSEEGRVLLTPTASGASRVTLKTVDGNFSDSVTIFVDSTLLTGISSSTAKDTITVGERLPITTVFTPATAENIALSYTSSNPKVLLVDENGIVRGVSSGVATVTVRSLIDSNIFTTVTITVRNTDTMDVEEMVSTTKANGKITISMETESAFDASHFSCLICKTDGTPYPDAPIEVTFTVEDGEVTLHYQYTDSAFVGDLVLALSYTEDGKEPIVKNCTLKKQQSSDFEVSFDGAVQKLFVGQNGVLRYSITPADADITLVSATAQNANLTLLSSASGILLTGKAGGVCPITLTFRTGDGVEKSFTHEVLVVPKGLSIAESTKEYGDQNLYAVGGIYTEGTSIREKLSFTTSSPLGENFYDCFLMESDNEKVYVDGDGVICFSDATFRGAVSFYASVRHGDIVERSAPFTVMCIADGVNVYSYADLYQAAKDKKVVLLHRDIKDDFGVLNGQTMYEEIMTTYDKTHFINLGILEKAKVKVLLSLHEDLYGNGHTISAHTVAYGLDSTGALKSDALFRGPLNFVSMTETGGAISVKGQDNICFALYEGVNLSNVTLRGCDLTAGEDGKMSLGDLTYTGTTVEVLGDNIEIAYCRLGNGRTVLRAYGDAEDASKEIHLTVTNSVITGAREFLVKIGSNCFSENGTFENPAPYLEGDSAASKDYETKDKYATLTTDEKAAYDDKYIKTYLTLRNSVLEHTGLFAVGIDSHFAGAALANGTHPDVVSKFEGFSTLLASWKNLAKTSYGAKLTLEGDVRMYTWMPLSDVDSSTLIEVLGESTFSKEMEFNVREMLENLAQKPQFAGVVYGDTPENYYVHAGIAFYGGGKNYGVLDYNLSGTSKDWTFGGYAVSFADIERSYLTMASGSEDFYFVIYDRATSGFSPMTQKEILASGKAYDCIKNP